jgi:hypothetical protein
MLRNIVSFIFIYIFIISCDDNVVGIYSQSECSNCILELTTELEVDENDYYHLNFINGSNQTFKRIDAQVGHDYEYVGWTSDTQYCFEWNGTEQCNNVVNGSSYSGMDGIASTILGVHDVHIGDTIKVYCGYYYMETQYLDSLEVIINE